MSDSEFPIALLDLIRRCAPTFSAVELLVFLEERRETTWTMDQLLESFRQRALGSFFIAENLARFQQFGLVEQQASGEFRYCPVSAELGETVKLLKIAFNERPVTLIRAIYAMADHSLQSFSDSFRIKDD